MAQTVAPAGEAGELRQPHERSHHRDLQGGAARAAVFGISDGLLTNISLILGVAGANPVPSVVLLAGLAGLVAGAFSMAAGEYVSMAAQSELLQRELEIERRELERHPEDETRELAATYRLRGVEEADARRIAEAIMRNPEVALEVHAREELGLQPGKTGNPWQAAGSSFVMFSIGAVIPLLPWFFTSGTTAALLSIVLGAVSVLAVGWTVAIFTGRSRVRSALRQLAFATVAAGVAFGVGHLVGNLVNVRRADPSLSRRSRQREAGTKVRACEELQGARCWLWCVPLVVLGSLSAAAKASAGSPTLTLVGASSGVIGSNVTYHYAWDLADCAAAEVAPGDTVVLNG